MSRYQDIGMFEPGSISCDCCGHKPEDGWDMSPNEFQVIDNHWYCDDCAVVVKAEDWDNFKRNIE